MAWPTDEEFDEAVRQARAVREDMNAKRRQEEAAEKHETLIRGALRVLTGHRLSQAMLDELGWTGSRITGEDLVRKAEDVLVQALLGRVS